MKNIKKVVFIFILFLTLISNAQKVKKTPPKKKNTCTTYVYNLSNGKMNIRDICYNVELTDHIDMNNYRVGQKWDKEYDNWKFSIKIVDFDKLQEENLTASFSVFEDNSEITQYHCKVESAEIKAIVYNKNLKSWGILLLQNDNYKMLSPYTGYKLTNAFNIKTKINNDDGY